MQTYQGGRLLYAEFRNALDDLSGHVQPDEGAIGSIEFRRIERDLLVLMSAWWRYAETHLEHEPASELVGGRP